MSETAMDFTDLKALFINTTLTRSPGTSHTQLLIDASASIMTKQGVQVDQFRAVDHPIATGVYPDKREHGWDTDAWPAAKSAAASSPATRTASNTAPPTSSTASNTSATALAPQSDAGWIGEAEPGPSYGDLLDDGSRAGTNNEFTQRNTTFMTWNMLHLARMLTIAGGFPAYGNQRREWDAGTRFDYPNPEYRA